MSASFESCRKSLQIQISRCLQQAAGNDLFAYELADLIVVSDVALPSLSAFSCQVPKEADSSIDSHHCNAVYKATGWLAGQDREVVCTYRESGCQLNISGIGRFSIESSPYRISCEQIDHDVSYVLVEEALLGPPLIAALAMRGIWCLHASVVEVNGKRVLVTGASGQGKSTLAAWLSQSGLGNASRVADDLIPCIERSGKVVVLPRFPQLKLSGIEQYPLLREDALPVDAVITLNAVGRERDVLLEKLGAGAAAHRLIEQTALVSLFSKQMHANHLSLIASLVGQVPVYALQYPHDPGKLPSVYQVIVNQIASQ